MSERAPSQALNGRARGLIVGSLIALGWAAFGLSGLAPIARYPLLAISIALTAILLKSGVAMQRRARSLSPPTPMQAQANKRIWRLFWLNLLGEIVLLNIAINLLTSAERRDFWIPAISAIVGLHFLPMAHFFRVRSYWWVGTAMMAVAAITAALILCFPNRASTFIPAEALANAMILWIALGMGTDAGRPEERATAG